MTPPPSAFCALAEPWEGFVIGSIGGYITLLGISLLEKMEIDDPVGWRSRVMWVTCVLVLLVVASVRWCSSAVHQCSASVRCINAVYRCVYKDFIRKWRLIPKIIISFSSVYEKQFNKIHPMLYNV